MPICSPYSSSTAASVDRVTFWGVGDGDSWLNNWPMRGRTNYPLLFDRQDLPKPAFDAVMNVRAKRARAQTMVSLITGRARGMIATVGDRPMRDAFGPVLKQSLSDKLAQRIRAMIQKGDYQQGDRLPPIMEMARRFGVGHPTIREALKKLETMGFVEIRHGSGVYVTRSEEVLVLASPDYVGHRDEEAAARSDSGSRAARDAVGRPTRARNAHARGSRRDAAAS